jgi:hypothetical protein
MQPSTNRASKHRGLGTLIVLVVWLALLGAAAANRQNLFDWWQLRHYQAPAEIAQLASQDTMTDYARKVFYVNEPAVPGKQQFAQDCKAAGQREQTIVLGCYHSNQAGIFLLSVSDPRLSGVEQVTAAHEMLHAAYDRLDGAEKNRINKLLLDYYHNDLHDQRIQNTMEAYKKTEPNDLVNEMHSIFGTEIANLPAPLEEYYQRYFTNRPAVAAFAAQYQAVFTSRQQTLTQLETQLDSLKQRIQAGEDDLKIQQATINEQQATLMAQRNSGNTGAYNAGVPAYNRLIDGYNAQIESIKSLISQYNQLVANHNALVLEQNQLRDELDASATPATKNH